MALSSADITQLQKAILAAYEPIIMEEVAKAVAEIPFRINEHISKLSQKEIREHLNAVLKQRLWISVEIKEPKDGLI